MITWFTSYINDRRSASHETNYFRVYNKRDSQTKENIELLVSVSSFPAVDTFIIIIGWLEKLTCYWKINFMKCKDGSWYFFSTKFRESVIVAIHGFQNYFPEELHPKFIKRPFTSVKVFSGHIANLLSKATVSCTRAKRNIMSLGKTLNCKTLFWINWRVLLGLAFTHSWQPREKVLNIIICISEL